MITTIILTTLISSNSYGLRSQSTWLISARLLFIDCPFSSSYSTKVGSTKQLESSHVVSIAINHNDFDCCFTVPPDLAAAIRSSDYNFVSWFPQSTSNWRHCWLKLGLEAKNKNVRAGALLMNQKQSVPILFFSFDSSQLPRVDYFSLKA